MFHKISIGLLTYIHHKTLRCKLAICTHLKLLRCKLATYTRLIIYTCFYKFYQIVCTHLTNSNITSLKICLT